ncbi:hypothetical protein [Halococcoides cellulosivorans]|uniref:hypothetical protein n=1 Tax=Halococcoides cellulosivorans TaxID=1679096 RepID=UPI00131F3A06|nr:hypothetical protein [Halococcoides cellulosivorans]
MISNSPNRRLRTGLVALAVVLVAVGASAGVGLVAAEETPTLVDHTDQLSVEPGGQVNVSVTYENASGVNIREVPNSWTVADDSGGVVTKSPDGESYQSVGWVRASNNTGTDWVVFDVPADAGGTYEFPLELERYKGGMISSTVSVSVEGTEPTTEPETTPTPDPTETPPESTIEPEPTTAAPDAPSVSVTDGSVAPGETVTVDVTAENAGVLSLSGIPTAWEIDSYDTAGGTPQDGTVDGAQKIGWTWDQDDDRSVSVTLSIPDDAAPGETDLTGEASSLDDETVTATGTVAVTESTTTTPEPGEQVPLRVVAGNVTAGETTTAQIVMDSAPMGVSGFGFTVDTSDTSLATITDVNHAVGEVDPQFVSKSVASDGSNATLSVADEAGAINETDSQVVLATVDLQAAADVDGTVALSLSDVEVTSDRRTGESAISGTEDGQLTVEDAGTEPGPSVSVTDGTVAPGETVTVDVTAENTGVLSLAGIPTAWEIDSYDDAGGSPVVGTVDGAQKIGWAWDQDDDRTVSVTLSIPDDATLGETDLTAVAEDTDDAMATSTGTITVEEAGPEPVEPSVSVTNGTVAPGETVTVDVTAENTGLLSLAGIQNNWTIDEYDENGATTVVDTADGARKIAWAWDQNDNRSVSITMTIPEDAALGETVLTAEAANADDLTATATGTITVEEATPTGPSVSVSNASALAGENMTLSLTTENTGVLTLSGIPSDWTIEAYDDADGTPQVGTVDDAQKIGWTWSENRSVTINVTLSAPSDAAAGTWTLDAVAQDGADRSASATGTLSVTEPEPTDTEDGSGSPPTGGNDRVPITPDEPDDDSGGAVQTPVPSDDDSETDEPETDEPTTDEPTTDEPTDEPTTTQAGGGEPPEDSSGGFVLPLLIVVVLVAAAGVLIYRR